MALLHTTVAASQVLHLITISVIEPFISKLIDVVNWFVSSELCVDGRELFTRNSYMQSLGKVFVFSDYKRR